MIFDRLDQTGLHDKDQAVLTMMNSFFDQYSALNQAAWSEGAIDTQYEAGVQNIQDNLYGNVPPFSDSRRFAFNHIRPIINVISGYQRRNRKSIVVVPRENGDQITADQYSKLMSWATGQDDMLETMSEAFHGALVTGMNLVQIWMDYRKDPVNGDLKLSTCPYNSFMIDPYFTKKDLSDCNGIWKRNFLTKAEAISLMPDRADEIASLPTTSQAPGMDGKFPFMPQSLNPTTSIPTNYVTYDEFYYRDFRDQQLIVDTETGEVLEWTYDNPQGLEKFLLENPTLTLMKQVVPTVRLAIVIQNKVFYHGPNPLGDHYPFIPVLGYYNPQMMDYSARVQGVVRGLRSAQFLYNHRMVIMLKILESQVATGWLYKADTLVNPQDVFQYGEGKGIALKKGAQMTDIQQIQPPQIPPSMIQMSEILSNEIKEISGVNSELLGSAIDDKAGILSMLRQGAGLTTLQGLFDNLDHALKLLGRRLLERMQASWTPGKVQRIIDEQPSPQFYGQAFGTYDAVIEEGLNTSTQRQMQFAQLLQLKEVGVPISTNDLLESSTIQNKTKIIENAIKQEQQQSQMSQMQLQSQMQEQQARTQLAQARSIADQGLGMERISRIEENKALAQERRAEALKDDEQALLNFVKALKEIDTIDLANLEKLIAINALHKNQSQINMEQDQSSIQGLS